METIQRDYAPKGVKFFYIYKALAHPENSGYVQPFTSEERLLHVKEAERTLGSQFTWICDNMNNDLKHALGNAPNSEFIIDPDGRVARRRGWSKPDQVRKDLEDLIGPVENPTRVADLEMKREPPPKVAASGVVPRVQIPGRMQALKIEPKNSTQPYYAKLRAEVESDVLRGGEGKMYIGFHMDPLYHVHWNNLAAPVKYEITTPDGVTITPAKGEGPKVEVEGDVDPREFLLEVATTAKSSEPLQLKVQYFACNDEEGWCKPVTQQYVIHLQADQDAGWTQKRGRPGSGDVARRPEGQGTGRPMPPNAQDRVMGRVVSINVKQGTLTVMTRDRKEQTFKISDSTMVMRDRQRSTVTDLKEMDRVMLGIDDSNKSDNGPPRVVRIMARSGQ